MTLGEILLENDTHNPARLAILYKSSNDCYTYGELNARVNRLSHALTDSGVRKGDRVAVVLHNCPQYIESFFACMKIGAVLTAIDFRITPQDLRYLLADSQANTLLIGEKYLGLISGSRCELGSVKNLVCIGNAIGNIQSYEELIAQRSSTNPGISVSEDDLATLYYTSGTTGRPKGVPMTHRNLYAAMTNMLEALPISSYDVTLHTSPFSHIASIWPLLAHCYVGGTNVTVHTSDPEAVLDTIETTSVTTWNTVPTMIRRIVEYPGLPSYDLGSLHWIGYGASPMPLELLKKAILSLGNIFVQVYGSTETYIATILPKEDHILDGTENQERRLKSCGKPLAGIELRVVNEQNRDIVPGEKGEIIIKGDSITDGYWRLPDETANRIKQGWFYTGDLATVDEDGYIYVIDRKRDIIISGGENISPKEVEEVIYRHPSVFEVAVIGVPDEEWGEAVKAIVVLRERKTAAEEQIISFCKDNLARFKAPKSVDLVSSLPKTSSGKISKKEIKERYI
ncbi:class I adenylate-forming enzyme family protein [Chloroflexota bacterium]